MKTDSAIILRLANVECVNHSCLKLSFNDGTQKTVDLRPLLEGPVFQILSAPEEFAKAFLDPVCGTVAWPSGIDLAPEALYALDPVG